MIAGIIGATGNNGVRSITAAIGDTFRRGRIGVGHPGHKDAVMPYVLGDFHNVADKEPDWASKYTANQVKYATDPNALKGFQRLRSSSAWT